MLGASGAAQAQDARWRITKERWEPSDEQDERGRLYRNWKKAVTKTFDWVDDDVKE